MDYKANGLQIEVTKKKTNGKVISAYFEKLSKQRKKDKEGKKDA